MDFFFFLKDTHHIYDRWKVNHQAIRKWLSEFGPWEHPVTHQQRLQDAGCILLSSWCDFDNESKYPACVCRSRSSFHCKTIPAAARRLEIKLEIDWTAWIGWLHWNGQQKCKLCCVLLDSSIKYRLHVHTHVLFHSPDGAINYVVNRLASLADCDQQRQPVFGSYSAFHLPRKSEFWVRNDDIQPYRVDSVPFVRWRSDCCCRSHCQPVHTYSVTEHYVMVCAWKHKSNIQHVLVDDNAVVTTF